jgi:hypothetical protein
MNAELYRAALREVSDHQLITIVAGNIRELMERNLLTPNDADALVTILTNVSHRAEGAALALNKLKENLS